MIQIFGWTILHSLWQLSLIAIAYLVLKTLWKQATSLQQYYLVLTAFVSSFLAPIFTFNYLWQQTTVAPVVSTLTPITNGPISVPTTVGTTEEVVLQTSLTFADYLTMCLPYLVVFWAIGVLYFVIRFMVNLFRINKLQRIENELITGEWLAKIRTFKKQLNIEKEVQVFLSKHVKEPITFGHFKPVILLPISLMTGFEPVAIETILLHELAHIKRHDYLINLGQSIIEIILFYHPCIWWLSKEIRAIREHCCDDLVLSMGDNRDAYVKTLTVLQWRKIGAVSNSLSMTASGEDGDFTRRIKRMFGVAEEGFSFRQLMGVFLVLLFLAVGGVFIKDYLPKIIHQGEQSSITILSEQESELKVTEKTTKAELNHWIEMVAAQGVEFDFKGTVYDKEGHITELRGNYATSGGQTGDFFATNIPCTYTTFNLYNDQLGGPFFTHPCKKESSEEKVIWIDKALLDTHVDKMIPKMQNEKIFEGFSFNPETYSFNGSYFVAEGETKWIEVGDVSKTPIRIVLKDGYVKSLEVIKKPSTQLSSWIINEDVTIKQLFEIAESFGKDSETRVHFNELDFDDNDKLTGKITGTIRPNKSGVFHFFEVHDISKYGILLQANADTILAPKYLPKGKSSISEVEQLSSKSSKIKINSQTTRKDLEKWASAITKHGVIFNYENSIFDAADKLIGLNGKFNGKCCFDDAFFVSKLDELEVHLEVKDNYICQPTIITQTEKGYDELKDEFWSDAVNHADDNPANSHPYWIEGAMRKMKIISNGDDKSYQVQQFPFNDLESYKNWRDSLNLSSKKNKTPSSFIPQLKEKEDFQKYVDSVAESSIGQNDSELRIDAKTGLFPNIQNTRNKLEDLSGVNPNFYPKSPNDFPKATFVNGHLIVGEDHPLVNSSPKATKKYQVEIEKDSLQNFIQWNDLKFELKPNPNKRGKSRFLPPNLKVTKLEWDRLQKAYFTFKIHGNWYKAKNVNNMVLVASRKDPISINTDGQYHQIILGDHNQVPRILENANVGDYIYYERIDFGGDFTMSIAVEIVENPTNTDTGFNVQKEVDFKNAEMTFSPDFIDASQNTSNNWRLLKESPLSILPNVNKPDRKIRLIGGGTSDVFFVNGIKWSSNSTKKLDPEIIESINVVSGTKAQLLYGVDKAVLITTKKVATEKE